MGCDYMIINDKELIKTILLLAVPIIIENIFQTLLGTIDTYFAGSLSDNAIAAIGVTSLMMNIYIAFYTAVSVGASTVISRYIWRKDNKKACEAITQSITAGLFCGIIVGLISLILYKQILNIAGARGDILSFAIPYYLIVAVPSVVLCLSQVLSSCLRSLKDTKTPMYITGFSNILNIVLNFVFMRHGLGIIGLGLATSISRCMVVVLLLMKINKMKKNMGFYFKENRVMVNTKILKSIVQIGLPAGVEKLIMRIGQLIYNGMIIGLGTISYVAHNIGGTIEGYSYIPAFGFGVATATLVGISLGENDIDKAKKITYIRCNNNDFYGNCRYIVFYLSTTAGFIIYGYSGSSTKGSISN